MNHSPTEGAQGSANSGTPSTPAGKAIVHLYSLLMEKNNTLERQLAQSEERVAQLEGALRVQIEASQHCLNKCDLLLGDSARMPGTFRGDLADRIRASKALLSSSKTN